jgi:hypothetical protein
VILRLQLQRAKAEFLRAPPYLIMKLRSIRRNASTAGKPIGMRPNGGGNQVVLSANVIHDRVGNQKRSIHAVRVHLPEHRFGIHLSATMPSRPQMGVRIEDMEGVLHGQ